MRLELTRVGLLVELANHYTTIGALETERNEVMTNICNLFKPSIYDNEEKTELTGNKG